MHLGVRLDSGAGVLARRSLPVRSVIPRCCQQAREDGSVSRAVVCIAHTCRVTHRPLPTYQLKYCQPGVECGLAPGA